MNQNIEFSIPFKGLGEGSHRYNLVADNEFFKAFDESEVSSGNVAVALEVVKRSAFIQLNFQIQGTVHIMCDRCLDQYAQPVENSFSMFVKFTDEEYEEGEEVIVLSPDAHEINVAQYVYEYILLSIPIQRRHPDDESGASTCNPEMLERLDDHLVDDKKPTDSRWDELKKLLDK